MRRIIGEIGICKRISCADRYRVVGFTNALTVSRLERQDRLRWRVHLSTLPFNAGSSPIQEGHECFSQSASPSPFSRRFHRRRVSSRFADKSFFPRAELLSNRSPFG